MKNKSFIKSYKKFLILTISFVIIFVIIFAYKYFGQSKNYYIITEWEIYRQSEFIGDEDNQFVSIAIIRDTSNINDSLNLKNKNTFINQLLIYEQKLKSYWSDENVCLNKEIISFDSSYLIPINFYELRIKDSIYKFISFLDYLIDDTKNIHTVAFDFNPRIGCLFSYFGGRSGF